MAGRNDALRHTERAVPFIFSEVVLAEFVAEHGRLPPDVSGDGFRVRIDQKLRGVESQTSLGIVITVNTIAIKLAWLDSDQINMPDVRRNFGDLVSLGFGLTGVVEET
jgi:hypothetical protein